MLQKGYSPASSRSRVAWSQLADVLSLNVPECCFVSSGLPWLIGAEGCDMADLRPIDDG